MPPNKKFPLNFAALSDLKSVLEKKEDIPDHAHPIATLDDHNNAKEEEDNDGEYFYGDIEENVSIPPQNEMSSSAVEGNDQDQRQSQQEDQEPSKDEDDGMNQQKQGTEQEEEDGGPDQSRRRVRRIIKKYSSIVQDPEELTIDEQRLQGAMKDVGKYAYGIQAISVWYVDEENDRLCPQQGGWWHNPDLQQSGALKRLTDPSRDDHEALQPVAPGVDIAGLLWLESRDTSKAVPSLAKKNLTSLNRLSVALSHGSPSALNHNTNVDAATAKDYSLQWRDLKSLIDDPDTAKGPRLELLAKAGIGQAAAITFETDVTTSGIVIFFAESNADMEILNGEANISYLRQSSIFIGAAAAMAEARRATIGHRRSTRSIRDTPTARVDDATDEESGEVSTPKDQPPSSTDNEGDDKGHDRTEDGHASHKPSYVPNRIRVGLQKLRGGGMQIPPSLSVRQSLWTAFGAFCGLLVLSSLNEYYQYLSDGDYALLIGPFGALMTLQYGLTAAPASQPRNAIFGQAIAGAVSLAFTYIPESILAVWLRRAVGPAIAIATMVKCGVTHPPAGAHAVLYASGKYNFAFYALVVLSTAISVIPAVLVNNLSHKRQYPTYWGLPTWLQVLTWGEKRGGEPNKK